MASLGFFLETQIVSKDLAPTALEIWKHSRLCQVVKYPLELYTSEPKFVSADISEDLSLYLNISIQNVFSFKFSFFFYNRITFQSLEDIWHSSLYFSMDCDFYRVWFDYRLITSNNKWMKMPMHGSAERLKQKHAKSLKAGHDLWCFLSFGGPTVTAVKPLSA